MKNSWFQVFQWPPVILACLFSIYGCQPASDGNSPTNAEPVTATDATSEQQKHLYVWLTDSDEEIGNFLAVVNGDAESESYGEVMATVVTEGIRGFAHHTSLEMPASGMLFANDFQGNYTYIFDTNATPQPVVAAEFGDIDGYSFAHSFSELPNGNIIATFQTKGVENKIPGGILELTAMGELVQAGDADIGNPDIYIRPYGLALLPKIDRIVTTNFDMRGQAKSYSMQVWRLSDLKLLHTVMLPGETLDAPRANPFEARTLPDGESVMIQTMSCGMYYMSNIDSDSPQIEFVHNFEGGDVCFLPVQSGDYFIQTVGSRETGGEMHVMDVSEPAMPKVVQKLALGKGWIPHWSSADASGERIIVGGFAVLASRMLMLNFDPENGSLTIDASFGEGDEKGPGLIVDRESWPHGDSGDAMAHGTVFGP